MPARIEKPIVGRMRRRIIIQAKNDTTQTTAGEAVDNWVTKGTVWAEIEPLTSREYWMAQQVQAEVTHKVTIRYFEGVRPDWRILYGKRVFDVRSVMNLNEENQWHMLMCNEKFK